MVGRSRPGRRPHRLELHVWVDNDPATSLYRSLGFEPAGMEMFKRLD
jgi:ribosomal protein S18 acetylase RimI-like enzyme